MSDLISRRDAIEYFMINTNWYDEEGDRIEDDEEKRKLLSDYFNGVPSAEPEIIHCKDCKYYDGRPCGVVDYYNIESDFCSWAERRTDD